MKELVKYITKLSKLILIILTDHFKEKSLSPINFIRFRGPTHIYNNIKNGNTLIENIEEDKKQFKSNVNEITTENPKYKSKDQLNTIKNTKTLYNSREKIIKLYNDYAKIKSEAIYKKKLGTGLKMLTPKKILQSLSIPPAQVKPCNNSKGLLN